MITWWGGGRSAFRQSVLVFQQAMKSMKTPMKCQNVASRTQKWILLSIRDRKNAVFLFEGENRCQSASVGRWESGCHGCLFHSNRWGNLKLLVERGAKTKSGSLLAVFLSCATKQFESPLFLFDEIVVENYQGKAFLACQRTHSRSCYWDKRCVSNSFPDRKCRLNGRRCTFCK